MTNIFHGLGFNVVDAADILDKYLDGSVLRILFFVDQIAWQMDRRIELSVVFDDAHSP